MSKVDLFLDAHHGGFGLLLVKQFGGVAVNDKFSNRIKTVLEKFSFLVINFVFCASGRLREKDKNDAKVDTSLEELELRVTVTPLLDSPSATVTADTQPEPETGNTDGSLVEMIGLLPWETEAVAPGDSPVQMTPNPASILGAIVGPEVLATEILSGLDLVFAPLFRPRPRILFKAFMSGTTEFGWYMQSKGETQQEGIHYTAAVLQVSRNVKTLKIEGEMLTDWKGGNVDNQEISISKEIKVDHPNKPETPQLSDLSDPSRMGLVLIETDVIKLLGVAQQALESLIGDGTLVAIGENSGKRRITRASLLKYLGWRHCQGRHWPEGPCPDPST